MVLALDLHSMEKKINASLGIKISLAMETQPLKREALTSEEHHRVNQFKSKSRQDSWLRGRGALQSLKYRDTPPIIFPNARASITHSQQVAIAAVTDDPSILGLGIDLEVGRFPKPESVRFFLNEDERDWITPFDESSAKMHRLRLWTVKESLFKANTMKRISLFHFRLEYPEKLTGKAAPYEMSYASFQVPGGYFSAAVLREAKERKM